MRLPASPAIVLAVVLALAPCALAAEDPDLDRIPLPGQAPPETGSGGSAANRIYLEQALTLPVWRGNLLVPPPPQAQPRWQERLSLDARRTWSLAPELRATYSGRLNFLAEEHGQFPTNDNLRHDFREGFASWEVRAQDYLDAGRINWRNGAAVGFNPTDFFKTRSVVDRTSKDPSVLRENRLGTLLLRGQTIGDSGALAVGYAPSVSGPSPVYGSILPSLDPMWDRTNADHRILVKFNRDLAEDFSPELLLYREGSRTKFGANLTREIGDSVIVYGEWAGGRRFSLIEEAFRYGQNTGTLPANAARVLPGNRGDRFYNDLALGGSYTTTARVTLNLEYHFHEAGLSRQDWDNWFDLGSGGSRATRGQLWFLRSYAQEQLEPLARHAAFVRVAWDQAFVPGLNLSAFANVNLYDLSRLTQVTAEYHWSDNWTLGAIAAASTGRARSERGSLLQEGAAILKAIRYF